MQFMSVGEAFILLILSAWFGAYLLQTDHKSGWATYGPIFAGFFYLVAGAGVGCAVFYLASCFWGWVASMTDLVG